MSCEHCEHCRRLQPGGRRPSKPFPARYAGRCKSCGGEIAKGDVIRMLHGPHHADCIPEAPQQYRDRDDEAEARAELAHLDDAARELG